MAVLSRYTKKNHIDIGLIFCVFVLVVIGLIMIYSTSAYEAGIEHGDTTFFLKKQIIAVVLGTAFMFFTAHLDYHYYIRLGKIAPFVAAATMLLLVTPLAYSANGATRWVRIFGMSLQPAEVVKIMMIIYMACKLGAKSVTVDNIVDMFKSAVVPAIFSLLIIVGTSNLSSGVIVALIAIVMVFVKSRNYKEFAIAIGAVLGVALLFILIVKYQDTLGWSLGYRGDRVKAWMDPEAYASDEGYQTLQSLYAIGSGGFMGKGIGASLQKLGKIPEAQNDMIFAIICEELGFFGAMCVLVVFFVLIVRCYYIALHSRDMIGALLAIGVMAHISIQVILNIAVVTNTIPNTGISLPFISYGGSSISFLMAEMGIVINVGKNIEVE